MRCARRFIAILLCALSLLPIYGQEAGADEAAPVLGELPLKSPQVLRLRLRSDIMGFDVRYIVCLPNGYGGGGAYPVWYGLHGYSTLETMWVDSVHINQTADAMTAAGDIPPMIMVFPFVRYDPAKVIAADMADGRRDELQSARFICNELIPYIDATFQTQADAKSRYIGGFSMGGLFALETGLRHPELFSRIGAYSPALAKKDYSGYALNDWLYPYAEQCADEDWAHAHGLHTVSVYLDCGGEGDVFTPGIVSLADELRRLGVCVDFQNHGGGHSIKRELLEAYLAFYGG